MLPTTKKKLNQLVASREWGYILIQHNQEGVPCIGLHQVYGDNNDDHRGVSLCPDPLLVANSLEDLQKEVVLLYQAVESPDVLSEKDINFFNATKVY